MIDFKRRRILVNTRLTMYKDYALIFKYLPSLFQKNSFVGKHGSVLYHYIANYTPMDEFCGTSIADNSATVLNLMV